MACVEQQDAGRDHFFRAQFFAVFLSRDQMRDQVIRRRVASRVDMAAQVVAEGGRGPSGCVFVCAGAARHIHAHHRVGPRKQLRRLVFWHAQQARDDDDGQLPGEMFEKVEIARREAVNQIMAELRDFWPQRFDAPRGEGAQDQAAQAGMARGFQLQHGVVLDGVERGQMGRDLRRIWVLASEPAVAQQA